MKTVAIAALLVVCFVSPSFAQDTPRFEISASATMRNPSMGVAPPSGDINYYGWIGSFGTNVNRWLGIEGEVAGYYSPDPRNLNIYTTLAGSQFTWRRADSRVQPWARFRIGAQYDHKFVFPPATPTVTPPGRAPATYFVFGPGVGVDVALNSRFSLRFGADTLRQSLGILGPAYNYRLQTGVVFKLP